MKVSYNWLKQYINCDLSVEEVSEKLTGTGLEVENITPYESIKNALKGVVVGKVLFCIKHPNSDHLHITKVDIGNTEPLNIVCGASNIAENQKVLVATVGTKLYKGDELFIIKKSKIRGEVSEGMICAEDELHLGESHEGIMVLPDDYEVGKPASYYFPVEQDYIIEISLTANRSDATSHIGVDRDLIVALNHQQNTDKYHLNIPSVDDFKVDNTNNKIEVIVEDTKACPRYSCITVSGVRPGPSPKWLKNRLETIGLRSINNIVDISNYVLMEIGQPLHIFDADKIKGGKIIVKYLPEGTPFITLDGIERKLNNTNLMICNAEEPMCIAGVFGGIASSVTENTTNVFIESAYFNPTSIRKTAKYHGLQTDASFRYERGCDPNTTIYALKRAAMLIKELAGGTISSEIQDIKNANFIPARINLSFAYLNKLAGQEIEKEKTVKILSNFNYKIIELDDQHITVDVPTYKVDVYRPADLVEEILRIYGYDNIVIPNKINASINFINKPDTEKLQRNISIMLTANGFYEIMNNSLTKSIYTQKIDSFDENKNVKIMNPLSTDLNVMRQSLLFGGLESIANNQNHKIFDMKFFEFGNIYFYDREKKQTQDQPLAQFSEDYCLDLFLTGNKEDISWNNKIQNVDFYDLKKYVLGILHKLNINIDTLDMREGKVAYFDYSLIYSLYGIELCTLGKINQKTLKFFDVKKDIYYATMNWKRLLKANKKAKPITYKALPKFPSVRRDLALILDKNVTFEQVRDVAFMAENKILTSVNLFDIYEGDQIPQDKKQYALSFTLLDTQKTLTDKIIEKTMMKMQTAIEQHLKATLR